jgi:hypothetical protein
VNPLRPLERKAIWGVAQIVLNTGVTRDDIQECRAEGTFPPDECEDTLQALEDEDEPVVGIPLLLILWLAGLLLLSLVWMTGPKSPDSN